MNLATILVSLAFAQVYSQQGIDKFNIDNVYSATSENNNNVNKNAKRILSRKRRYLVFPEGSSFQVVWDGIIPIVDYTNYLILGITVALAWELPSKPPSEIIEELQDKLNDGTLGLHRNDTFNKIKYIDAKHLNGKFQIPSFYKLSETSSIYTQPTKTSTWDKYSNKNWKATNPWIYGDDMVSNHSSSYQKVFDNYYNKNKYTKDYYSNFNRKYANRNGDYWKAEDRYSQYSPHETIPHNNLNHVNQKPTERFHRVYPVFGKRSIPDGKNSLHRRVRRDVEMDKIDRIHLRYHRSTRNDLYEKIEKYLQTHMFAKTILRFTSTQMLLSDVTSEPK
ncbi:hypothetical protein ACFFRR_001013 [Megaselia abdita]